MNYFKPILVIGILIPMAIGAIVVGGGWYIFSGISEKYEFRSIAYAQLQQEKAQVARLREEVLPHKGAIAYFDEVKRERVDEKLPAFISDLCDRELDGFIIRNSLDFGGGGGVAISLTGRYDALQKLVAKLSARFPFLDMTGISLGVGEPDGSIPSRHIVFSYTGEIAKQTDPASVGLGVEVPQ